MHYSLRTEQPVDVDSWIKDCPTCKPTRMMDIIEIMPLILSNASVVTYRCIACGHADDILIEASDDTSVVNNACK
jgi:hypothetical protein